LEERAIPAVAPRRRLPVQARPLVPPRKPRKRFVGPLVLAGLVLGLVFVVLRAGSDPTPAPGKASVAVTGEGDVTTVQGVPGQAADAPRASSEPTPDPQVVNEQRLREAVFAPFRAVDGRYGIVVKDLATGQAVTLNERFPFQAASLYKLPVMYEVFKQRDLDLFALNEELTIGSEDVAMDLGSLPWPVGTRITIGTALDRMVTLSDNSGAYMLAKKVGTGRINEDMLSLGLAHTYIRGDDLQTSAADMARLLEIIARGQALSAETSAEMVHLMARQQVRNRIPVLMPPEAVVANKTGNWEGAAHDVAIVYGPSATFVIALLADGITDFDGLYLAMATAARNVYDVLNDPVFASSASPALPRSLVGSYQVPPKLPSGGSASNGAGTGAPSMAPQPRVAPPTAVVPVLPTALPVDKPRGAPPAAPASAPGQAAAPAVAPALAPAAPQATPPSTAGPALAPKPAAKPTAKPAEKPAEKPQQQATAAPAPAGTPATKPSAPSIFTMPTPTKTP
jgi:beta-lactamase class A